MRLTPAGKMAAKLEPLAASEEAEEGEGEGCAGCQRHENHSLLFPQGPNNACLAHGQTKPLKTEDLLSMVKKLQKEGSLEPQIEDLISRINELQQAKKKSNEELGETQALWETLHRELDSLNGEKVHLEEVLRKKQEALRILQLHCQRKESEAQRSHMEEQLEDFMGQHKDLWEFQVLERRLAWEIRALQSSKEQLLTEENLARAKLEQVEQRLRSSSPTVQGALAVNEELKVELEKSGEQVPTQTQSPSGDWAHKEEPDPESLCARHEEDLEPLVELALWSP